MFSRFLRREVVFSERFASASIRWTCAASWVGGETEYCLWISDWLPVLTTVVYGWEMLISGDQCTVPIGRCMRFVRRLVADRHTKLKTVVMVVESLIHSHADHYVCLVM